MNPANGSNVEKKGTRAQGEQRKEKAENGKDKGECVYVVDGEGALTVFDCV